MLSHIDITHDGFTDNSERKTNRCGNTCVCECPNEGLWDIHREYALGSGKINRRNAHLYFIGEHLFFCNISCKVCKSMNNH